MTSATNPNLAVPNQPEPAPLFDEQEARLRTELYIQQRLDFQENYYIKRIEEFQFNGNRMLFASAVLMGFSTALSAISIASNHPSIAFITALLPAVATMVAAFRALYQWQRQEGLYEDTRLALYQARLAMPDDDYIEPGDYGRYFPELVRQAEAVLQNEASQWGQMDRLLTETDDGGQDTTSPTP